ncbi:hypothetical protein QBC41DRAFT_394543 [Cercophora samala]|uniref:Uncharacterized protein n=1 Tax=Cercophora samala TaxID=330535 RepID=A0AA39ZC56_9PEZI|nr:hypothetical protein QBC41DRAFT_394543 [Cercophora samala]
MAPTPKATPIRRPLTLKGVERKKPGPAPKPLSEKLKAKALKQIKRVERSYTRERKIEVLLYLLTHRVPDQGPRKTPRRRIGQPQEDCSTQPVVENENGELVWYRAPTYAEASAFWKIPTPTIQGWWDSRDKLLEGTGIEVPKVGPGGVPKALEGWKPLSQRSTFRTAEGMQQEEPDGTVAKSSTNGAPPTPSSSGPPSAVPTTPAPITPSVRIIGRVNPQPHYKPPPAPRPPAPLAPAPALQIPPAQNRPVPQAPPVEAPPVPQTNRPAAQPAPQHAPQPGKSGPQAAAHPGPAYPQIPPAFNPSNYVVLYTGPHPGPWSYPGQHCIPPGTVLPIVYAGQPVELGPPCFVTVYPGPPSSALTPPAPNGMHHHRPPQPQPAPQPGQHSVPQPGQAQGPPQAPHHGQQQAHPPHGNRPPHASHGLPPNAQPPHASSPNQGQPQAQRPTGPSPPGPYMGPSGYIGPYAPPGFAPANQAGPPPQPPQNTPPPAVPNGVATQPVSKTQQQVPVIAQVPPATGSNSALVAASVASSTAPTASQAAGPVSVPQQDASSNDNRADDNIVSDQADVASSSHALAPVLPSGDQDGVVPADNVSEGSTTTADRDSSLAVTTHQQAVSEEVVPEKDMRDATPEEGENGATTTSSMSDDDDAAMEEALEHAMEEAMQQDAMLEESADAETASSSSALSSIRDDTAETQMDIDNENQSSSPSQNGEAFETPYEAPAVVETEGGDEDEEDDVMVDTPPEDTPTQPAASEAEAEAVESEEE